MLMLILSFQYFDVDIEFFNNKVFLAKSVGQDRQLGQQVTAADLSVSLSRQHNPIPLFLPCHILLPKSCLVSLPIELLLIQSVALYH